MLDAGGTVNVMSDKNTIKIFDCHGEPATLGGRGG